MSTLLIKKLHSQELAYTYGIPGQARGQYFFISKRALGFFPKLSKRVINDAIILNVISHHSNQVSQAKLIYHNDIFHGRSRDEVRLYLNENINPNKTVFLKDDIAVICKSHMTNEYLQEEEVYIITRFRAEKEKNDYRLLEQILKNPKYRLNPQNTYALIVREDLFDIENYKHRIFENFIQGGQIPIVDDEQSIDEISKVHRKKSELDDVNQESIGDLERQLRRMIFSSI